MSTKSNQRVAAMPFASIYPAYLAKVTKKGRSQDELDAIICWLTGHTKRSLYAELEKTTDFMRFFKNAPKLNPKRRLVTGVVCGVRVEDVDDPFMKKVRQLDKLVDELARGKSMESILPK